MESLELPSWKFVIYHKDPAFLPVEAIGDITPFRNGEMYIRAKFIAKLNLLAKEGLYRSRGTGWTNYLYAEPGEDLIEVRRFYAHNITYNNNIYYINLENCEILEWYKITQTKLMSNKIYKIIKEMRKFGFGL